MESKFFILEFYVNALVMIGVDLGVRKGEGVGVSNSLEESRMFWMKGKFLIAEI